MIDIKSRIEKEIKNNIISITPISSGRESDVYLINTADKKLVAKTPKNENTNYLFEAFCYQAVSDLGGAVLGVVFAAENLLIITQTEGTTLNNRESFYDDDKIFEAAAKNLFLLSKITGEGFGEVKWKNQEDKKLTAKCKNLNNLFIDLINNITKPQKAIRLFSF